MADFILNASDADFLEKAEQFSQTITQTPADYGLNAAQVAEFDTFVSNFDRSLGEHITAQADALSKTQAKETERDALEQLMRQFLRIAKANPTTTEAQIALLGLPSCSSAVSSSATVPIGKIDTSQRLEHAIYFSDASTPNIKRKPKGVIGCEIWAKIDGSSPADNSECQFLTLDTKTPYVAHYEGTDAGKMAHYLLRWKMKTGESAWSDNLSATITG